MYIMDTTSGLSENVYNSLLYCSFKNLHSFNVLSLACVSHLENMNTIQNTFVTYIKFEHTL